MKGAGSLGEPRDRKHRTSERSERGGAQRVPREPSEPGAFKALLFAVVLSGSEPGAFIITGVSNPLAGLPTEEFPDRSRGRM